ncbi:hypothetical protein K435DRAFT_689715 [Dendrothele bispora CBS 962.96]|uniref:Uncharacterized protein n=1 Tax=Dendrothele bispora (strain CBS 962.96) TaxID=1314807 RepID=A0A4S8L454_DENBC|nr:hypothetical protein K435DRAFT_689715 [Dendrothele bispora CBS 962.96]
MSKSSLSSPSPSSSSVPVTPSSMNGGPDPVRASVGHLLSRAYSLPCSTTAQTFMQLVQPTARFQLALDALLPLLDPVGPCELAQRILASFILYSLYAPHPIAINPFKSVLYTTFTKEREKAVNVAHTGGVCSNEQLIWVLWKILKGDGNDIGPYSPATLARSPLPPKLRATNLLLDEELDAQSHYSNEPETDDSRSGTDWSSTTSDAGGNATTPNTTTAASSAAAERYATPTPEEEVRNETIAKAMKLLLAARERVLTLSEQRFIVPAMPLLVASQMITKLDLAPLVSYNSTIAYPLFVALLTTNTSTTRDGHQINNLPSPFLEVLPFLPPTLSTFDLMGKLLRDPTPIGHPAGGFTVGELVRSEVLGRFIHESVNWLDQAERQEREGLISDDRFALGVQNLCRFYHSLIKLSIVNPSLDTESTEIAHFSLRNARFEEANALYRTLVNIN